jgi:hypothetical protein
MSSSAQPGDRHGASRDSARAITRRLHPLMPNRGRCGSTCLCAGQYDYSRSAIPLDVSGQALGPIPKQPDRSPTMSCLSMASSPRLSGAEQPVLALSVLRCRSLAPASHCLQRLRQGRRGSCTRRAHRTWERMAAVDRLVVQARFRAARNATRHGYRCSHDGDADHVTCRVRTARGFGGGWCRRLG